MESSGAVIESGSYDLIEGAAVPRINSMPVEVLSKAFALLGDDFAARYLELILELPGVVEYRYVETPDLGDKYSARLRDIMRRAMPCSYVTSVCRHWYNIAVSTPQLWSCPPIFHPEATSLFTTRADGTALEWPLVASQLRSSTLADPERQRALLPMLLPRTRGLLWLHNLDIQETRLHLGQPGQPLSLAEVDQALSHITDALQALYVINRGNSMMVIPLPEQLSGPVPPRLHTLYIRGRGLHASHPLFTSTLQSLTLTSVASVWDDVDGMLDTLAGLPDLERLVLRATTRGSIFATEPTNTITLASERRVYLRKLKSLTLDDRMRSLAGILYALAVPQPAFRDVMVKVFDADSVAAFSRALDANYQRDAAAGSGFKGFEHVYIEVGGDPQHTFVRACLLHAGPGHLALPDAARRVDILSKKAHFVLRTYGHAQEFIAALEILSGTPVVCLDGVAHKDISHMHNIRWLGIDPFFAAGFVADAAEGRLDKSLTAGLAVLQFEGAAFAMDHEPPESENDPVPINMRLLLPWLSLLVSRGTFRLLCLFSCRIKHIAQIASLKAVIGEHRLYWDGAIDAGRGASASGVQEAHGP